MYNKNKANRDLPALGIRGGGGGVVVDDGGVGGGSSSSGGRRRTRSYCSSSRQEKREMRPNLSLDKIQVIVKITP